AVAGWSFSASAASGVVMGGIWNTDGDQIGEITGVQTNVSVSGDAGYTFIIGGDLKATPYDPPEDASGLLEYHFPRCFLAGTPILMADGQEKPIEDIRVGDMVMSFDPSADQGRGALVPKPVSRTFQNVTRSIIDLRGLYMTPGHVCLTDDGRFETIAEILLRDGILIEADGTPIRARTGAKVGSMEDIPVLIAYPDEKTGKEIFVRARAGIPCRLVRERDGTKRHLSLALMLRAYHQTLTPEGLIISPDGSLGEATDWPEDSTPMDEDYRRNWVIQTADGKPYVPEWIAAVAEEAREEQTVGDTLQRIISPPSVRFTPKVVDNPTPRVNARR
ncbi:MAG: Hint domain-containing homing endonuclease, partial [Acetobacteraceae bacterium]